MSEVFVGQIKMFAGTFAPRGYALCEGQLLAVSSHDALFSLLGTIYGGDGRSTFGLPDLRGRLPIHVGNGPGLPTYREGQKSGTETVTLTINQMTSHKHTWQASTAVASAADPSNNYLAQSQADIYNEEDVERTLATQAVSKVGGSQQHTNLMPAQCINYIIALVGVYPSRS